MATILITGGTGLIGKALTKELLAKGYEVMVLTRKSPDNQKKVSRLSYANWDIEKGEIDKEAIQKADAVIHLAGANVADGRWTDKRKKEIVDSRTKSASLLVKVLQNIPNRVRAVITSSAIGWYGPDPQIPNPAPFVETDPADTAFLGATCKLWEESINPVIDLGKRLVKLRTGIVLSPNGGAFVEFKKPLRFGIASILGNGKQVVSWLHINDMVGMYAYALENEEMEGIYNAVAPNPVSNKQLILAMAKAKGGLVVPAHVPEFALKTALGEMSVEVLKSTTVSANKMERAGYRFQFPDIQAAVANLMKG